MSCELVLLALNLVGILIMLLRWRYIMVSDPVRKTNNKLVLAKEAYLRYGSVTDYKNFRGEPMPEFDDLPATIKNAWVAVIKK